MLTINNLNKAYMIKNQKVMANNDISFNAQDGEVLWIFGNSGAGKSTLLNTISGIDKPDSGYIAWGDYELSNQNAKTNSRFRLNNCGLIFQFFELLKTQTAYNNAILPLRIAANDTKENRQYVYSLFEEFGITDLLSKYPHELSGGEKQRIAIIRSLANKPRYFIADEITASLDKENSRKIYEFMRNYIKRNNGIGIFVSHDTTIKDYVDATYEMNAGKLTKCI